MARWTWRLPSERWAVSAVLLFSAVLHLSMLASMPLILTPNSQEYIGVATALLERGELTLNAMRTPGYPILLAAVFGIFGRNPVGLLVVQHLLAIATCGILALVAARLAGTRAALIVGLLAAAEPWSLILPNYALDETVTVHCAVLAVAVAALSRSPRFSVAFGLGVLLALSCLMRPALQVMIPFAAGAWLVGITCDMRRRAVLTLSIALGLAAAALPWLAYNYHRGVNGFARGSGLVMWYGVAMFDLLDRSYEVDARTRESFERNVQENRTEGDHWVMKVLWETEAETSAEQNALLGRWAASSIRQKPLSYVVAMAYSLLWQLDVGIRFKPPIYDELHFFIERLTQDGTKTGAVAPNFQGAGAFPGWHSFVMNWRGGILEPYLLWCSTWFRGWPQVPLFVASLGALLTALFKRDWRIALLLLGSLAIVGAHCALLATLTRYSMPAWTIWYIALAFLMQRPSTAAVEPSAHLDD